MTRQATKKKRDKNRALKKKHEHVTEKMAEETARKKRSHSEEIIAIVVLLIFVPFMVTGILWWPASTGKSKGDTGLPDGTYNAEFLGSRPATESEVAVGALEVNGESFFINERDLSGSAAGDPGAFFGLERGAPVRITAENGFVTDWAPAELP